MSIIPYDAQIILELPIMVWLGIIGVAIYLWFWWKLRHRDDGD